MLTNTLSKFGKCLTKELNLENRSHLQTLMHTFLCYVLSREAYKNTDINIPLSIDLWQRRQTAKGPLKCWLSSMQSQASTNCYVKLIIGTGSITLTNTHVQLLTLGLSFLTINYYYYFVSDIPVFVLKRDIKLQLTHSLLLLQLFNGLFPRQPG